MIRVSLRGLTARPLRTILTALAIVLGVGMVTASFTFTDTMRSAADSLSSDSYDGTAAVVSAKTAFEVDEDDWAVKKPTLDPSVIQKVEAVDGVAMAVPDITDQNTKIIGKDGKPLGQGPYFGVGMDATKPGAEQLTPFRIKKGRWATGAGEVVIDQMTHEKEGYGVGDTVKISGEGAARSFEVVGVASFGSVKSLGPATAVIFDIATAQDVIGRGDKVDSVLIAAEKGVPAADVRRAVTAAVGEQATVQTAAAHDRFTFDGLKMFIDIIKIVLLAFGGVAIFVGAFTIFNALSITVKQRTRELGLLRMVGASRRQVLGGVMLEALAIGVLASLVGLLAGLGLAIGLSEMFTAMGLELPSGDTVFGARTVLVAAGVGVFVTLVAGLIPAWRATRVAPVAALRDAAGAGKTGRFGRVIRSVTGVVGLPIQKMGGSAGMLARRNAMRLPGRTASTAAALTIGVALTTMVTVVATGLKDSTSGSLERRIDAAYVITGQDGWSPVDKAAADAAVAVPGVSAVSGVRQDGGQAFGQTEIVNGVQDRTISKVFAFDWVEGDDGVPSSLGRDGAIVDEGWATEHGLTVGESFEVQSATGETLMLRVRGIEESPVLDAMGLGPITVGEMAFDKAFAMDKAFITMVAAPESAKAALEDALKPFPDAMVSTTDAFISDRTADVDMLLAIFAVLLALAVLVSLFGIVNTLVLSTFERTRELGMLRAVGMSRRQVRRMVRGESVITALLGAALGIVVGLGLAAIATSLLADEGLTFVVPIPALVIFTVVAILAGIAAAVLPARRASRLDVLGALAYE
jgi:putative ABC transport system permease protein